MYEQFYVVNGGSYRGCAVFDFVLDQFGDVRNGPQLGPGGSRVRSE